MAASTPQIPKIVTFSLGGTSFAEDIIDCEIVPTPGEVTKVTTLDGIVHQDVATESWAIRVNMILDHDSGRPGLAYYLNQNKGTTVAFIYNAHGTGAESASQPKYTGSCKLQPVSYGGDGNTFAEYEVLLPIIGVPTRDATP
jgi:hypothetical protein